MEILVNQEPLDYQLEDESSLGDVLDGLFAWLHEGQYTITAVDVNDQEVAVDADDDWRDRALSDIERISVHAMPLDQLESATLATLSEYVSLVRQSLENDDRTTLNELLADISSVAPRLLHLFPELADTQNPARALLDALEAPHRDTDEHRALQRSAAQLGVLLNGRLREHLAPDQELAATLGRLASLSGDVRDVPVALQTGEEKHAMDTIIRLTELFGKAVRLLPHAGVESFDLPRLKELLQQTGPHLQELEQAFHAQDTVLIGDLLEYELAPLLDMLAEVVLVETEGGASS